MDLSSNYYPFLEVNGKHPDLIFRELTTNDAYRLIEDGTWEEAFINRYGQMLEEAPNVRTTANQILREGLQKKGFNINPEKVYVNTFNSSVVIDKKGVFHREGSLVESYRLTDAALLNFFNENYTDRWSVLGSYSDIGVYSIGKEGKFESSQPLFGKGWGPSAQVCVAKEPADVLYYSDLQAAYTEHYQAFWDKYLDEYREMIADLFIAAAIRQYKAGSLSEYGFAMVRKVYAGQPEVETYQFNIDTYDATDIIVMVGKVSDLDHTILYIPGASTPFVEFDQFTQMRKWLIKQLADPAALAAFRRHFSIYERQEGTTYSGVDVILKKMLAGTLNPQDYIMLHPIRLNYDKVFSQVRNRIKYAMEDDANRKITSNSEFYRDYVLRFVEGMLGQVSVFDMLVPEIGIPLDLALSTTALGISLDIVKNADTYKARLDGVGSLVSSGIYTVTNFLPVFLEVGTALKNFTRVPTEIPIYADEERFMMGKFHIGTTEELHAIKAGDNPYVFQDPKSEMRLVRLADGDKQLVVIRKLGGNKYIRVNPMTFEDLEGEGFISEVMAGSKSNRILYVSNSRLLGGAPYNPFEHFFDEIWTVEELKRKVDKLGVDDAAFIGIKGRLQAIHSSLDFYTKQKAAHEVLYLIKEYVKSTPAVLRKKPLLQLAEQIKSTLYDPEVAYLRRRLVEPAKVKNSQVCSHIYKVSQGEQLGELPPEITHGLVRFAEEDDILSIASISGAYQGEIPPDISFEVKYVINDLSEVNTLGKDFTKLPEFEGTDLVTNTDVFHYALEQSQGVGLLHKCIISDNGKKLFIGYSYAEFISTITKHSCNANTLFGTYPAIVLEMILYLLKGGGEGALMARFGRGIYWNRLIEQRLGNMEDIIKFYDYTVFARYDRRVSDVFGKSFDRAVTDQAKLDIMMSSRNGILFREGEKELTFCCDNLDFFKSKGVTHIGLTCFYSDLHQTAINSFMAGSGLDTELLAIIITADLGVYEGPMFKLIMAAREKKFEVLALGHSDGVGYTARSLFTKAYNKGTVVMGAASLLRGKKCIVVSDTQLAYTSPGLVVPIPGLSQILEIPAFRAPSPKHNIRFWPDVRQNRTIIYVKPEKDWLTMAPPIGHFRGWRKFDANFKFLTAREHEKAIFAKVFEDLEGFKKELEEIRGIVLPYACGAGRRCDKTSSVVRTALAAARKNLGNGVSLAWWKRDGNTFANQVHTAPTVVIRGIEIVVDATYLDPLGEAVSFMLVDEWAEEVFQRFKGYNAYLADRTMGDALYGFRCPEFTRPRLRKI